MSILILADHHNNTLSEQVLKTVSAAQKLNDFVKTDIDILVIGHNCRPVAEQAAKIDGIRQVLLVDGVIFENMLAEPVADFVSVIMENKGGFLRDTGISDSYYDYDYLLAASTTNGKNILPRIAAECDVMQISDVMGIEDYNQFVRPTYAGNAIATVQSKDKFKIMTIRTASFDKVSMNNNVEIIPYDTNRPYIIVEKNHSSTTSSQTIQSSEIIHSKGLSTYISTESSKSDRPELTSAKIVISGGRGMQNGENFAMLERIADKLNAAIGASRAAVDAGFVPNDYQVGQTGKIVAPDLYIAVGISGAIQHLAGMKDSKVIVAINKDADAPIFQIANYGIVGDLFEIIPALEKELEKIGY